MKLSKTALYDFHISRQGKMVQFSGYSLPAYYTSINDEHTLVRSSVGLFDISHMGEIVVSGLDAESFLQKVTINDIESIEVGQAQYTAMCNYDGGIVDDLILYRNSDNYMLVVNAGNINKNLNWLNKNKIGNVKVSNISDDISIIAVQGPKSRSVLEMLTEENLANIDFYSFVNGEVAGFDTMISRTGYTGELGYELYLSSKNVVDVWRKLLKVGNDYGIAPVGLGCRDTLRMEMKYLLYGNDINETRNPIESGLGWITKINKGSFIGKEAILNCKDNVQNKLVCIKMLERAIPRKGLMIYKNEKLIGEITSGTMSPSLGFGIGIGYVNVNYSNIGREIQIDVRGKLKKAVILKPPFYKNGTLLQ